MTVKELKQEIRQLTGEVNLNISEYRASGKKTRAFEQEIKKLQAYGSKASPTRRAETVGLGFRGKTKLQLQRQLSELRRVADKDVWTPAGARRITAAKNKSWLAFKKNHEDWTKEKWQTFTDTFGHLTDSLKEKFGYMSKYGDRERTRKNNNVGVTNESLLNAFDKAYDDKLDLTQLMEEVIKENKGKSLNQDKAIEQLMLKIKERSAARDNRK